MTRAALVFALAAAMLCATFAAAKPRSYALPEETAILRDGPGRETAQNNCSACHSPDYISTQPSKKGRAFWQGVVKKMINVYHAPISETDAQTIIDYLSQTY